MGNQPSSSQYSQNSQRNPIQNQQLIAVQLRMLIQNVVKQFQYLGEQNIQQFIQQIKISNKFVRGQNFQGRVDQNGKIYGIAKYFSRQDMKCDLFFGECVDGRPWGCGINVKTDFIVGDKGKHILDINVYQAYLLQKWQTDPQNIQDGSVLKSNGSTLTYFKGKLKDRLYNYGKLTVKKQDVVKLIYQGQFKMNRIQGKGTLQIPGISIYKGYFVRQEKSGIGWEKDIIRDTQYVGQFQSDKRHGYGELSYGKNRQQVKLKGFWTNGIIKPGEGMYIARDGSFMETIGDEIQLL